MLGLSDSVKSHSPIKRSKLFSPLKFPMETSGQIPGFPTEVSSYGFDGESAGVRASILFCLGKVKRKKCCYLV